MLDYEWSAFGEAFWLLLDDHEGNPRVASDGFRDLRPLGLTIIPVVGRIR